MMKKLSAIFMAALMIVLSVSIVGAATVDTEDVGSNGWKLATPFGIKAVNEGPDDTEYGKMPINIDFVRKVVCFNYMPKAGLEFPNDRRIVICSNVK